MTDQLPKPTGLSKPTVPSGDDDFFNQDFSRYGMPEKDLEIGGKDIAVGLAGSSMKALGTGIAETSMGGLARGARAIADGTLAKGIADSVAEKVNPDGTGLLDGMASFSPEIQEAQKSDPVDGAASKVGNAIGDAAEWVGDKADKVITPATKTIGSALKSGGESVIKNGTSADYQEAVGRELFTGNSLSTLKLGSGAGDAAVWAAKMVDGIGSISGTVAAGALTGGTVSSLVKRQMLKRGAGEELASETARLAGIKWGQRGAVAAGVNMSTGQAAEQARAQVNALSWDQLTQSQTFMDQASQIAADPEFAGKSATEILDEAKRRTGDHAASIAMSDPKTWAAAAAGTVLGDANLFKMLQGVGAKGAIKGLVQGAAGEATGEAIEEGTQQYVGNEATNKAGGQQIDPWDGVAQAAATAGTIGALTGGITGTIGGARGQYAPQSDGTAPDVQPDANNQDQPVETGDNERTSQPPLGAGETQFDELRDVPAFVRQDGGRFKGWAEDSEVQRALAGDFGPSVAELVKRQVEQGDQGPTPQEKPIVDAMNAPLGLPHKDVIFAGDANAKQPGTEVAALGAFDDKQAGPGPQFRGAERTRWQDGQEGDVLPPEAGGNPAGALPGRVIEGEAREVGTELPYRDVVYGQDGRPDQQATAARDQAVAAQNEQLKSAPPAIGQSDTIFAAGAQGADNKNNAYTPPRLSRDQIDTSLGEQSIRDPRTDAGQAIQQAGSEADAIFGQLKSLRITKRGKPFASLKEAQLASRKTETPIELPTGGFGVVEKAELEAVQASQPTDVAADPVSQEISQEPTAPVINEGTKPPEADNAAMPQQLPETEPVQQQTRESSMPPTDGVAPEQNTAPAPDAGVSVSGPQRFTIEPLTDKSIIVKGDKNDAELKEKVEAAWPKAKPLYNERLKGWVFGSKREGVVREALADLNQTDGEGHTGQASETKVGEISQDVAKIIGRQAGKVILRDGDEATGRIHIQNRHGDQISAVGFKSVSDFVAHVVEEPSAIYKGKGRGLYLVKEEKPYGLAIVQLEPSDDGDFYDVKTATPMRKDQFKNKEPLYVFAGPSKQSTEVDPLNPKGKSDSSPRSIANGVMDKKPAYKRQKEISISDFGEKIGGARKDVWTSYRDSIEGNTAEQIAELPLSKAWPAPDYQKLIDSGVDAKAVGLMRAAREAIPSKPRNSYKVKSWASAVKDLRDLSMQLLDGSLDTKSAWHAMSRSSLRGTRNLLNKADLYQAVGHQRSLADLTLEDGEYSLMDGVHYSPAKRIWSMSREGSSTAFGNWPRMFITGDTKEQVIAEFKKRYDQLTSEQTKPKAVSFDIYSNDRRASWIIGKKVGRNYIPLSVPFTELAAARSYREENHDALVAELEKRKAIPNERRDINQPRVGEDMRSGADVTPEMFSNAFGFRGVEFGNWVEGSRRQRDLNDAYDALMDMAAVLNIHPKAISLNGQLGLAFGARGSGGVSPAAAHYEPGKVVINLTKMNGAGSLGHEWWHALDNYFGRMRGDSGSMSDARDVGLAARGSNYLHQGAVRKEMVDAFGAVKRAIDQTAIKARSSKLDGKRSKDYWTTDKEMSARAFESYLISKLQDQGVSNDYLANVVSQDTWGAMSSMGFELDESYPYPTAGEIPGIRAGFDHFFDTIEQKQDGDRVALFSMHKPSGTPGMQKSLSAEEVNSIANAWAGQYKGASGIKLMVANNQDEIAEVMDMAGESMPAEGDIVEAVYLPRFNALLLNSAEIHSPDRVRELMRHEVLAHHGLRKVVGDDLYLTILNAVKHGGEIKSIKEAYYRVAQNYAGAHGDMQAEEVFAHWAENQPERGDLYLWWRGVLRTVKDSLRKVGLLGPKTTEDEFNRVLDAIVIGMRNGRKPGRQVLESWHEVPAYSLNGDPLYSKKASDLLEQAKQVAQESPSSMINALKQKRPVALGALTDLQIDQIFKNVTGGAISQYQKLRTKMEADRNEILLNAETKVDPLWDELGKEQKAVLSSLMHDATMTKLHPDLSLDDNSLYQEAKDRLDKAVKPETKARYQDELNTIRDNWKDLNQRYQLALDPKSRALYQTMKGVYDTQWSDLRDAIEQRLEDLMGAEGKTIVAELRLQMERALQHGPYFPLARFGDYVVKARKGDEYLREHFERRKDAERAVQQYQRDGYQAVMTVKEEGKGDAANTHSLGLQILSKLDEAAAKGSAPTAIKDDVWQAMLQMLPDASYAKHAIHRRRVKGASRDGHRAYLNSVYHFAHHVSKIRYGHKMQAELDGMNQQIQAGVNGEQSTIQPEDLEVAQQVLNEMNKRHDLNMNPKGKAWAGWAGNIGFVWYMAGSPASALINMTQNFTVMLPQLGAKYGFAKAALHLGKALKDYIKLGAFKPGTKEAWVSLTRSSKLPADERQMLETLYKAGALDLTQAHSIAARADTDLQDVKPGAVWQRKTVAIMGSMFHNAEVLNREVAALAAYRLLKEQSPNLSPEQYADKVTEMVYNGHGNYAASNRPRYMRGDAVKVLTQFKIYSQLMTYTLYRNAYLACKGDRVALKTLGGLMGTHFIMAGVMGLPFPVTAALYGIASAFDDDDDRTGEASFRLGLSEVLGKDLGELVAKGPMDYLTGLSIAGRTGINDLWYREPKEGTEGDDLAWHVTQQIAGPVLGIGVQALRGLSMMGDGDYERGAETMMPKAVKDLMKTYRQASEGERTRKGDVIIDDVSAWNLAAQAMGFSSAAMAKAYDAREYIKGKEERIESDRSRLLSDYILARKNGDSDEMENVLQRIREFNATHYRTEVITGKTIRQSLMSKRRSGSRTQDGTYLSKKREYLRKEGDFAF